MSKLLQMRREILGLGRGLSGKNRDKANSILRLLDELAGSSQDIVASFYEGEPLQIVNAGDYGSLAASVRVADRTNKRSGRRQMVVKKCLLISEREVTEHNLEIIHQEFKSSES